MAFEESVVVVVVVKGLERIGGHLVERERWWRWWWWWWGVYEGIRKREGWVEKVEEEEFDGLGLSNVEKSVCVCECECGVGLNASMQDKKRVKEAFQELI